MRREGLSYEKIANIAGASIITVRNWLIKGRKVSRLQEIKVGMALDKYDMEYPPPTEEDLLRMELDLLRRKNG
jgi:hypothetical protein|tara:strand:- start:175 stop:393 length:219 start_codon:yes stop_codon:yes gene_type:complete